MTTSLWLPTIQILCTSFLLTWIYLITASLQSCMTDESLEYPQIPETFHLESKHWRYCGHLWMNGFQFRWNSVNFHRCSNITMARLKKDCKLQQFMLSWESFQTISVSVSMYIVQVYLEQMTMLWLWETSGQQWTESIRLSITQYSWNNSIHLSEANILWTTAPW